MLKAEIRTPVINVTKALKLVSDSLMGFAMTLLELKGRQLFERIAQALCGFEALECAHESARVGQLVSLCAGMDTATIAIDRNERASYAGMDGPSNRYANALRELGAVLVPITRRHMSRD